MQGCNPLLELESTMLRFFAYLMGDFLLTLRALPCAISAIEPGAEGRRLQKARPKIQLQGLETLLGRCVILNP